MQVRVPYTQAFLITVLWLYRKFKALEETGNSQENVIQKMSSTVLAYDNMCHMDNLVISRSLLPFPYPYDQIWKRIGKVIDRLHLRNHVDQKCHKLYNPDDRIPKEFNTMACEQTFVWASRLKKLCVLCLIYTSFTFFIEWSSIEIFIQKNVMLGTRAPFFQKLKRFRNVNCSKCSI